MAIHVLQANAKNRAKFSFAIIRAQERPAGGGPSLLDHALKQSEPFIYLLIGTAYDENMSRRYII